MENNAINTSDQIQVYTDTIYSMVDDFVNDELIRDPDILENKGFFPRLLNYITNNYIINILNNNDNNTAKRYPDIEILEHLFDIYLDLVYKYKPNKLPTLVEYSLFINIHRDTLHSWITGEVRNITSNHSDLVKRINLVCENALVNATSNPVKEIFLLKAKHGYQDTQPQEFIISTNNVLTASNLPKLGNVAQSNIPQIVDNQ